jgi:membrane protein DedA with SNARE-associated domain
VLSILSIVIPALVGILLIVALALIIWWIWRRATRKHPAIAQTK